MTIEDLAKQLTQCTGLELYRLMQILKEMRTAEARAKIRSREQKLAAQAAWKRANTQYKQVYKTYRSKFTKHK